MTCREAAQNPLTFEEKKNLIASISTLSANKIQHVIEIVRAALPANRGDDDDVEIPIDDLDTLTLRKLQRFVEVNSMSGARATVSGWSV